MNHKNLITKTTKSPLQGKVRKGYIPANTPPAHAESKHFHQRVFVLHNREERYNNAKSNRVFSKKTYSIYTTITHAFPFGYKHYDYYTKRRTKN